jgi:hypothetical protein
MKWEEFGTLQFRMGLLSRTPVCLLIVHTKWSWHFVSKDSMEELDGISNRVMVARFQAKIRNAIIIQCHTPTEDAHIEEKIKCYVLLINQPKRSINLNGRFTCESWM